jgi:hypothetical protein
MLVEEMLCDELLVSDMRSLSEKREIIRAGTSMHRDCARNHA